MGTANAILRLLSTALFILLFSSFNCSADLWAPIDDSYPTFRDWGAGGGLIAIAALILFAATGARILIYLICTPLFIAGLVEGKMAFVLLGAICLVPALFFSWQEWKSDAADAKAKYKPAVRDDKNHTKVTSPRPNDRATQKKHEEVGEKANGTNPRKPLIRCPNCRSTYEHIYNARQHTLRCLLCGFDYPESEIKNYVQT